MKRLLFLLLAVLWPGGSPGLLAKVLWSHTTPAGIGVEVTSPYENLPLSFAIPFSVEITNPTGQTGHWRFTARDSSYRSNLTFAADFSVAPGERRSFPLFLPVRPDPLHGIPAPSLNASMQGTGFPESHYFRINHQLNGHPGAPKSGAMLALGREVGIQSLEPLKTHFDKTLKASLSVTQIDTLPEDWRALEGMDLILITLNEWHAATPAAQRALRQWAVSGGELALAAADSRSLPFPVPVPEGASAAYGTGAVRHARYDGTPLRPETITQWLDAVEKKRSLPHPGDQLYFKKGASGIGIELPKVPRFLILSALIGLAVLIGPVNLFWLAPAGRRHRLFVTTPLLSLGGCALLLAVILFHDGTGGTGHRFTLHRLVPGEPEAVVYQHQVSRTGLIVSAGFRIGEEALPSFVYQSRQNHPDLLATTDSFSGTWFRSRCLQVMEIGNVRPTRAALTVTGTTPEGAPVVLSSLPAPADTLFVRDREGRYWKAENVRTGEKAALAPASATDLRSWLRQVRGSSLCPGTRTDRLFLSLSDNPPPGTFYALGRETEPIETLASLRWKRDTAFHVGELTQTAEAPR